MPKKNKKNITLLLLIIVLALLSAVAVFFVLKKSKTPEVSTSQDLLNTENEKTQIFFASNGKNSVYKIKNGDKWSVIWKGQEGKEYDAVSNPVFSADGSQLAYAAELNGQTYVVVNNDIEINAYQGADYLVFSQDGTAIAFVSTKSDSAYVVITVDLENVSSETVISGEESAAYEEIGVFDSPDGDETSVILSPNGEQTVFTIVEDDKIYIVVNDEQIGEAYDSVTDLTINDEGEYSYIATIGNTTITVVDNVVVPPVETTLPTDTTTSSDSIPVETPTSYPTEVHKYKISTQKDIDLNDDRMDYSGCSGANCNF